MSEILGNTLSWLKLSWREVLLVHLVYTGLGVILFAPMLGLFGQMLLKLSGRPALADMDLLFFALSPVGFVVFVIFLAITIVVSAFEFASLMAIGVSRANGKVAGVVSALVFSIGRVKLILGFAIRLVIRLLLTVAPFLLLGSAVAYLLISEHDINYYLTVQPPEFWKAVIVNGIILLLMMLFLLQRLASWSLALPQVLFAGVRPADSFAASATTTSQSRGLILRCLAAWAGVILLLGVLETAAVQALAAILAPVFMDTVMLLAVLFGLLTILLMAMGVLMVALATGSLGFLLAALVHRLETGSHAFELQPVWPVAALPSRLEQRWQVAVFLSAIGAAVLLGASLLDDIRFEDHAQIIAHRGAAAIAPENSMASIRQAITDGADWIEIDVQETADGAVVVIHDSDLMKLAGVSLKVWEATLEQLSDIDIGGWFAPEFSGERVPTLAAVLAAVKGRSRLIIELKYYGHDEQLEQRVIDLVEAADMQDDVMIMSLEYSGIQRVRALRPDWKIGLLSARAVGDLTRLDADFLAVNMALARPAMVRTAHDADKELYVWTVNDPLSMSQMMSLGVDGIITDEPSMGIGVQQARAQLNSVQRLLLHMAPLFGLEAPSLSIDSNDAPASSNKEYLELSLHQRLRDRVSRPDAVLAEFTTDGCSGGLSVGWDYFAQQAGFFRERHGRKPPWEECCVEHDRIYHAGGSTGLTAMENLQERKQADDKLRACVLDTASERVDPLIAAYSLDEHQITSLYATIAESMYTAVRLGGMPCTGLSWRWGYGWPDCR